MALVRVLLADDHAGVRAELRLQLGKVFEIIGEVEDGKQAVDATLRLDPDVLLLDISMPVMNGFQVAAHLQNMKCRSKIVILTTYEDDEYIHAAFSSGADAYVTKAQLATDLVPAIREVLHGNTFISSSLRRQEPPRSITVVTSPLHSLTLVFGEQTAQARVNACLQQLGARAVQSVPIFAACSCFRAHS